MSFEDPFKLRVLTAFTAAFKTITPDAGYVNDLSDQVTLDEDDVEIDRKGRVFRGRGWFGEDDLLPMVSVLEGVNPADEVDEQPIDTTTGEFDWPLLVQGFVDDDPENPTDPAYRLLADVRQRLAVERARKASGTHQPDPFGLGLAGRNRIVSISIGPGVVRPADDVSSKAYFWLTVVLRIVDNASTPYA